MTTLVAEPLRFVASTHQYFVGDRELPGVTRILQDAGLADYSRPWFTEEARTRGSMVHAAIALDNEGTLDFDALDPALVPYVTGWRKYLAESQAVVEFYETPICDPAIGYAGTLDVIVLEPRQPGVPVRRTLLDIKPALYPSVGPQTAAYVRCARSLYDTPVLFQRAALVLDGDGGYRRVPLTDPTDEQTFLAAVRVAQFRRTHGLCA